VTGSESLDGRRLVEDVEDLKAQLRKLTADLDRLRTDADAHNASAAGSTDDASHDGGPEFILRLDAGPRAVELAALDEWVRLVLIPIYGREPSSQWRWCARWFEHPEAVARLHALLLAWHAHRSRRRRTLWPRGVAPGSPGSDPGRADRAAGAVRGLPRRPGPPGSAAPSATGSGRRPRACPTEPR